jgi:hypothetical protein
VSPARRSTAVLLLSAGVLAWEVLLIRIFAIEQFHHFASMAIGVAMLGGGAAGTGFALIRAGGRADPSGWFAPLALGAGAAFALAPLGAEAIRVDPTVLAWDARQWARLALLYLLLALPFFLAAGATLAALAGAGTRTGMVYGASLAGSGIGAVLPLSLLWFLDPLQATPVPALLAGLAAWLAAPARSGQQRVRLLAAVVGLGSIGLMLWRPLHPRALPYKSLSQVLAFPDARATAERGSPSGWVTTVEAPAFRYAPGLSLAYRGAFPSQAGIFSDGNVVGALSRWDTASVSLLDWQPSALPFWLGARKRVLIIGGGAHELANAIHHGATYVKVVEPQPLVARFSRAALPVAGGNRAVVEWEVDHARSVVARDEAFDLVLIGPSAGGSPGLSTTTLAEEYDLTVEAHQRYLHVLSPGGMLALTGWSSDPPAENVRIILTAGEALRRQSPEALAAGMIVVRSWGTATTLVKPAGFTPEEIGRLEEWCDSRWFDIDWRPGLVSPEAQFNLVDRPVLFEAARAAVTSSDSARRFAAASLFDVRPATDDRPYPHHVIGLRAMGRFLAEPRGDWLSFADWGSLALMATVIQGAVLGLLLMGLPLLLGRSRMSGRPGARLITFFAAIGVGFLAVEIALMQQLVLLLGHPAYSVTAVLVVLLMASGVGSLVSDRVPWETGRHLIGLIPLLLLIYGLGLLPLVQRAEGLTLPLRWVTALAVLTPVSFLMGFPFSMGLRHFAGDDSRRVAWSWAANGYASVVTAPLAALIALELGTGAVFLLAVLGYLIASLLFARTLTGPRACSPSA